MSLIKGEVSIHRVIKISIDGVRNVGDTDPIYTRSIVITNMDTDGKEYDVEISLFSESDGALRLLI